MRANFFLSLVVTAAALALSDATLAEPAPDTPKKPVATEYHGVTVEDPYQWLENDNDPQVKQSPGAYLGLTLSSVRRLVKKSI